MLYSYCGVNFRGICGWPFPTNLPPRQKNIQKELSLLLKFKNRRQENTFPQISKKKPYKLQSTNLNLNYSKVFFSVIPDSISRCNLEAKLSFNILYWLNQRDQKRHYKSYFPTLYTSIIPLWSSQLQVKALQ